MWEPNQEIFTLFYLCVLCENSENLRWEGGCVKSSSNCCMMLILVLQIDVHVEVIQCDNRSVLVCEHFAAHLQCMQRHHGPQVDHAQSVHLS